MVENTLTTEVSMPAVSADASRGVAPNADVKVAHAARHAMKTGH
jgi:hypothetical protein